MYATSVNPLFLVSIEKTVKAENRLVDQKSKVVPNDPQMVWEHFGGVFRCFQPFLGCFTPISSEKRLFCPFWAISNDFDRFLAISGGISPA